MKKFLFTAISLFVLHFHTKAQVDTINAQNNKLQLQNLKLGTSEYLVYMTDSLFTKRTVGDIWQRTTSLKMFQNKEVIAFNWNWLKSDSVIATIVNICDRKTLAPIYHHANYKGRGVFAYDYREGWMIPSDTIKNNMAVKK